MLVRVYRIFKELQNLTNADFLAQFVLKLYMDKKKAKKSADNLHTLLFLYDHPVMIKK